MARQTSIIKFTGSVQNLTGYKVGEEHFLKTKTVISKEKIRKDPRFANTRRNAEWFGIAVKFAKAVYDQLPLEARSQKNTWYPMLSKALELVRLDTHSDSIMEILCKKWLQPATTPPVLTETHMQKTAVKLSQLPVEQKETMPVPALPHKLRLGRACGPVDAALLIDQLSASSVLIKKLLVKTDAPSTRLSQFRRVRLE